MGRQPTKHGQEERSNQPASAVEAHLCTVPDGSLDGTLQRATRLYEMLSRVNESIVRTHDEQSLFEQVCKIVAEVGGYPLAWIGIVRGRQVAPVARAGTASEYLDGIRVEVDGELGQGPSGTSIREGRAVINDDFDVNLKTAPWRAVALEHGFRASASFPLRREGKVIGSLTLYSVRPSAFDEAQVKLLDSLSADLSYALDAIAHERRREDAEAAPAKSEARLRLLSRSASCLLAAVEPLPVVKDLCTAVMEHLGCDAFFNFIVDEKQGRLHLNAWAGIPDEEARRIEWLDFGVAVCGCVARDCQRITAEDIQHSADIRADLVRSYGIQAYCCHPLVAEGRVVGTLSFGTKNRPTFAAEEVELMRTVADQVATAMERVMAREALARANLQLVEADHRKNDFLAVLSHELRNPLAPITNSLYILDHAPPGGEQAGRAKQVIARQVAQMSNLVNDLLDVTRISRNKIQLSKERLELNEVTCRAVEDSRSLFERAGVRLEVEVAPRPLYVLADRTRIVQVIGNLLQNAAKFAHQGGVTRVTLALEGAGAVVRVADDGIGIAPDALARLFQPFMQVDQTLDRSKGGLGLGLALVKGLVELHGGSVAARSEGIGKGTEFVVGLPLDVGAALGMGSSAPARKRLRRRVLIIEDNRDAAESLREVLQLDEHEVEVAHNGPAGIAKAETFKPDVVFCDIGLPGMNGYDVARAVRSSDRLKQTYLVALSGYALAEDLQRAAQAGFDLHLAKPPAIEKLEALLESIPARTPAAPPDRRHESPPSGRFDKAGAGT